MAVYGGNLLLCSSILMAILLGTPFQVDAQQSLFLAACLSFSSNPLASRILDRETREDYIVIIIIIIVVVVNYYYCFEDDDDYSHWFLLGGSIAKYQKPNLEGGKSPEGKDH